MLTQEIEIVKSTVSEVFGIQEHLMDKKTRKRDIVEARYTAMVIIRLVDKTMPLKRMGACFGHQYHHSTVIHATQAVNDWLQTDKRFIALYKEAFSRVKTLIDKKANDLLSDETIVQEKEVISLLMLSCEGLPIRTGLLDTVS